MRTIFNNPCFTDLYNMESVSEKSKEDKFLLESLMRNLSSESELYRNRLCLRSFPAVKVRLNIDKDNLKRIYRSCTPESRVPGISPL